MKCKVDGCERDVMYVEQCVCQKHYFRFMRKGHYNLDERTRNKRVVMPGRGYIRLYDPSHPLADSQGYVSEHRKVVFDRIGFELRECELCGKAVTWSDVHVDHIDNNPANNSPDNLRPLCRPCNTFREYPEQHSIAGHISVTFEGETKTPEEWSRDSRVSVAGWVIRNRLKTGMSVEDALFSAKKTHNGNKPKPAIRKTTAAYQRKNSIAITIDGETKTAMEWSRDSRCSVSDGAIRLRIKNGWNPVDAVLVPAKAHYVAKLKELKR